MKKIELEIIKITRGHPKPIPKDELEEAWNCTLAEYLDLPYTIKLIPEEDGAYYVYVEELPGCASMGDTPEEAMANIKEAMEGWIESNLERGLEIPLPERYNEE